MADIKALKCPSCGGPLDIPEGMTTIHCAYCGTTLQVGERAANRGQEAIYSELNTQVQDIRKIGEAIRAGNKIEAIKIFRETFGVDLKTAKEAVERLSEGQPVQVGGMRIETQTSTSEYTSVFDPTAIAAAGIGTAAATSAAGCGISAVISLLVVGALVLAGAVFLFIPAGPLSDLLPLQVSQVISDTVGEDVIPLPLGYASEVASYGSKGLNPGQFSDARYISVDAAGNIYVGDYGTGQITVLDPSGEFVARWSALPEGEDGYLVSMTASRDGRVYALVNTAIQVIDGSTGEHLGTLDYAEAFTFDDLAVTAEGSVIASWMGGGGVDNLVAFDVNGTPRSIAENVIHGLTGDPELSPLVATDGSGNIYVLGLFNDIVVKLSPAGVLQTRFGSDGSEDGQFTAPTAIAVDSQGRIYVADIWGIQVFSSDGRFLDKFNVHGSVRDMAFDSNDNLYLVTLDQKVVKLQINAD